MRQFKVVRGEIPISAAIFRAKPKRRKKVAQPAPARTSREFDEAMRDCLCALVNDIVRRKHRR
jgi:hypothetical protein